MHTEMLSDGPRVHCCMDSCLANMAIFQIIPNYKSFICVSLTPVFCYAFVFNVDEPVVVQRQQRNDMGIVSTT